MDRKTIGRCVSRAMCCLTWRRCNLRRCEDVEEAGRGGHARGREASWASECTSEASFTVLWGGSRLADGSRQPSFGQVPGQLIHLLLLFLVLHIQQLHIFFEPSPLLPHILYMLTFLLELEQSQNHKGASTDFKMTSFPKVWRSCAGYNRPGQSRSGE